MLECDVIVFAGTILQKAMGGAYRGVGTRGSMAAARPLALSVAPIPTRVNTANTNNNNNSHDNYHQNEPCTSPYSRRGPQIQ